MTENQISYKICTHCKASLPITDFRFKNISKNRRYSYCYTCRQGITKDHYEEHKDAYLKRNARFRLRNSEIIREHKSKPCADCGIQYPYYVMDFDHRDGEVKLVNLGNARSMTRPQILKEIAKCDVVCSNCHRERTYQREIKKQYIKCESLRGHQLNRASEGPPNHLISNEQRKLRPQVLSFPSASVVKRQLDEPFVAAATVKGQDACIL